MKVTVGICTWNRAEMLDRTLQQIRRLVVPQTVTWEVVVVNNRCTDDTDQVLSEHAQALPLRRLYEPEPGKSRALNRAIESIDADMILWTDDDVLVDPQWLAAYVQAAQQNPRSAFFGGTIEPWFEVPPPDWLPPAWEQVAAVYASRNPGDKPRPIEPSWIPFGANFAIRAAVQQRYRYDPQLGRVGPNDVRGEETDVIQRMLADGLQGHWWPAAKVQHFVPQQRMTTQYLRDFYHGIGQTHVLAGDVESGTGMWSATRNWSKAMFAEARFQVTRRICRPQRWVKDLEKSSYYWGRLAARPAA